MDDRASLRVAWLRELRTRFGDLTQQFREGIGRRNSTALLARCAEAFGFFVLMEAIFLVLLMILARENVGRPSILANPAE